MGNPFKSLILSAATIALRQGDIVATLLLYAIASQLPDE